MFYEYILINQNIIYFIYFLNFFYWLLSDIKKLNSVSLRFFLQIIFLIIFCNIIIGIEIKSTRVEYLDLIISNNLANIIFVSFCLMVLVNGGNFIDGLNGLLLKYYIIIYLLFFYFGHYPNVKLIF